MIIKLNNEGVNIVITTDTNRIYYGSAGTSGNFKPIDTNRGGELNGFLITLGGDCYSVAFDDLQINGYSPTTLLFAAEALQGLFSNTPYTPPPLILQYDGAGNVPYTTLEDWNDFFDLPAKGIGFTSVIIEGEYVYLRGGKGIALKDSLFFENIKIKSITDEAYCITSAETQAFGGCHNLIGVNLPLLKTAGNSCFRNCGNIPFFDKLPSLITANKDCFNGCNSATSFDLPSLQSTGNGCFSNCTSATTFDLPLLQNAGDSCFYNCTSAISFSLPLLKNAGDGCFSNCTSATTFNLPLLETTGIKECFSNCTSATTFDLPSLQSAGANCFQQCSSATTFDLPLLVSAGNDCFAGCTSATLFNLPVVINLGETVGDDSVFNGIEGNTISLTILPFLMVCNEGQPDGDIVYLQDNNDVTITLV